MGRRSATIRLALTVGVVLLTAACGGSTGVSPRADGPAAGSSSSAPGTTDGQAASIALLRPDARVACAALTTGLPSSAVDAIRCEVDADPIDRLDVLTFESPKEAARAYLRRLEGADIRPRSGNCESGKGGDGAWAPGDDPRDVSASDGVLYQGAYYVPARYGCFAEDGVAHAIATCGKRLIEVVGTARSLELLHTWVWTYADDAEVKEPVPPGICTGG